jgi:arsenite methyltransferase
MSHLKPEEIRESVTKRYGEIARSQRSGCGCSPSGCCSASAAKPEKSSAMAAGYTAEQLQSAPEGSNLGLGCGNPQAHAGLKTGETVLDLGSGAGFDCFLAARQVGETGLVIGVDMTPEMVTNAREYARSAGYGNVDFRFGDIESLPVPDATVDCIISNCVVNLSPDKRTVFREAFRVLKPGGRLAISDVVATADLPADVRSDLTLYSSCVAGALPIGELESLLRETGFSDVRIVPKDQSRELIREWAPGRNLEDYLLSAIIEGVKPVARS